MTIQGESTFLTCSIKHDTHILLHFLYDIKHKLLDEYEYAFSQCRICIFKEITRTKYHANGSYRDPAMASFSDRPISMFEKKKSETNEIVTLMSWEKDLTNTHVIMKMYICGSN